MKKKMKKFWAGMCAIVMLCAMAMSLNVMASSGSGTVRVPTYSVYKSAVDNATRTGSYSYVTVRVDRVYPTGSGTDNYSLCKTVLYNQNYMMSDEVVATEGYSFNLPIKEGYLNLKYFNLCFAGCNPELAAFVDYYYNGN